MTLGLRVRGMRRFIFWKHPHELEPIFQYATTVDISHMGHDMGLGFGFQMGVLFGTISNYREDAYATLITLTVARLQEDTWRFMDLVITHV